MLAVYRPTTAFPREELDDLTTQIRRASSSIAANLKEGCGRTGDAELARFCVIAMGSASELQYHLLLARDLNLVPSKDYPRSEHHRSQANANLTNSKAES